MTVYARTFQNQEGELLQALAKASSVPVQIVQRAKLILRSAEKSQTLDHRPGDQPERFAATRVDQALQRRGGARVVRSAPLGTPPAV